VSDVGQELLDGLARVPTGVLADVLSEMGLRQQVVTQALRPVAATPRFVGRAVCVAGRDDRDAKLMPGPLPTMFDVDELVAPGSVVVVDSGDHGNGAVIGGLVALAFKRAGAAGFITDGGVRDVDELTEMGLPCISRFVTPGSVKGRWSVTAVNQPITLPAQGEGQVTLAPGDIVSADADGVVVIPSALAADVLADALQVEKAEAAILTAIQQGHDRREAFRANDRFGHIRKRV
jgi:regulator of RNase E activity RraA